MSTRFDSDSAQRYAPLDNDGVHGRVELLARPAWRVRLAARLPRALIALCLLAMCAAGVRATLAPAEPPGPPGRPSAGVDQAAEAFAEGFARAYLSWDPARPELRERAVAKYLSDELDPTAGVEPARAQDVRWTAVVGVRRRDDRQVVTVAAETDSGSYHVAVPVERDERGLFAVVAYPALVGPPPVGLDRPADDDLDVVDAGLRAVCERALRNYLAGDRADLLADLDADAVVSLPEHRLELKAVDRLTRAGPGRVGAELQASGAGAVWTLRYELDLVRRDRWYVRAISTDPRATTNRRSR
ncbi:MAG TPA: conjugal transfer protein [Thermoleophilaceae bacterium]|jgi:hypothetical protein